MSSSMLPPEYISATTAPASGSPSASAAVIDRSAMASTPKRPAKRSRTMNTASAAATGAVAIVQMRPASAGRSAMRARMPAAKPQIAITTRVAA